MPKGDRRKLKQLDEDIRQQLIAQRRALLDGASSSTSLTSPSPSPSPLPTLTPSSAPDLSDDEEDTQDQLDYESDGEWPEYDHATAIPVGTKFLESFDEDSKNKRGRATGAKSDKLVRMTRNKINIKWSELYRGPDIGEIDNRFAHDLGIAIRDNVKMKIDQWGKRSKEDMFSVLSYVANKYNLDIEDRDLWCYVNDKASESFRRWKHYCHKYWKMHKKRIPTQFGTRPDEWQWLHRHFSSPKFQKMAKQNAINRANMKMFHHAGSTSFAHLQGRARLNNEPAPIISAFAKGYAGDPEGERHAARMRDRVDEILKERQSQNPGVSQEELGPLDQENEVEVMIEELGERPGTYIRGCGRGVKRAPKNRSGVFNSNKRLETDPAFIELKEQNEELKQQMKQMNEEWNEKMNALMLMMQNRCQSAPFMQPRDEDSANGGGSANGLSTC